MFVIEFWANIFVTWKQLTGKPPYKIAFVVHYLLISPFQPLASHGIGLQILVLSLLLPLPLLLFPVDIVDYFSIVPKVRACLHTCFVSMTQLFIKIVCGECGTVVPSSWQDLNPLRVNVTETAIFSGSVASTDLINIQVNCI